MVEYSKYESSSHALIMLTVGCRYVATTYLGVIKRRSVILCDQKIEEESRGINHFFHGTCEMAFLPFFLQRSLSSHSLHTNHMLTAPMIDQLLCSLVDEWDQTKLGIDSLYV
jgi:hypothetical protein